jgi:hypothetical protein
MLVSLSGVILVHVIWSFESMAYAGIHLQGGYDYGLMDSTVYTILSTCWTIFYYVALSSLLIGLYLRAVQKHQL